MNALRCLIKMVREGKLTITKPLEWNIKLAYIINDHHLKWLEEKMESHLAMYLISPAKKPLEDRSA